MFADNVENFIEELVNSTCEGKLKWTLVDKMPEWKRIKEKVENKFEDDFKSYSIDASGSFHISIVDGQVLLLSMKYKYAQIFSPVLDEMCLIICMNDVPSPINLSECNADGFKELLVKLRKEIEELDFEEHGMPDVVYNFFASFSEFCCR